MMKRTAPPPRRGCLLTWTGLLWLAGATAHGATPERWHPPDGVRAAAESFARAQLGAAGDIEVEVVSVDERLKLPRCAAPLETSSQRPLDMRGGTVTVSCPGTPSWRLFVPVRVSVATPVVVTRRNIPRGDVLAAADLRVVTLRSSALPYEYLSRIEDAVGLTVRRPLSEAAVVVPAALERPTLVARGSLVTLVARSGGIEVKSQGLAVQSAGRNERVRIQSRSGRIVEGTVEAANLVRVGR